MNYRINKHLNIYNKKKYLYIYYLKENEPKRIKLFPPYSDMFLAFFKIKTFTLSQFITLPKILTPNSRTADNYKKFFSMLSKEGIIEQTRK